MTSAGCDSSTVDWRRISRSTEASWRARAPSAITLIPATAMGVARFMRYARRSVLFNHAVTPLLKEVRRAAQRGSLTAEGFAVAEGFHLLEEALRSRCEIGSVIVAEPVRATVEAHVRGLKRTRV